jgi:hypothetical protein
MMVTVMNMKSIIIEYLFLGILFLTLIIVGLRQKRLSAIVPVNNLRHMCKSEEERMLYDGIINQGIYVTPSIQVGFCTIPIALEQFKIAIFLYPKRRTAVFKYLQLRHKEFYLRSIGWKVFKFSEEAVQHHLDYTIHVVVKDEKLKKV